MLQFCIGCEFVKLPITNISWGGFFCLFILLSSSFSVFCNKCLAIASKFKASKRQHFPVLEKQITQKVCSQEKQEEENTFEQSHEWCHSCHQLSQGTWWVLDIIDIISAQISLLGRQSLTKPPPDDKSGLTLQSMFQIKTGQILKMLGGSEGHACSAVWTQITWLYFPASFHINNILVHEGRQEILWTHQATPN